MTHQTNEELRDQLDRKFNKYFEHYEDVEQSHIDKMVNEILSLIPQPEQLLKDHMIADLNNIVRDELNEKIPNLPECLRELIWRATDKWIRKHGLKSVTNEPEGGIK